MGSAGPLGRTLLARRRQPKVDTTIRSAMLRIGSYTISALATLSDKCSESELTAVGIFLRTPEADALARQIAIAILATDGELREGDRQSIEAELAALLQLVANLPPPRAVSIAPVLLGVLAGQTSQARQVLRATDASAFGSITDRAVTERNVGMTSQARVLTRHLPGIRDVTATEITDFLAAYVPVLHEETGILIPAYVDSQRDVPIDEFYINPRFTQDLDEELDAGTGSFAASQLGTVVIRTPRLVVLGDPGAGKSTLAQKIAHDITAPLVSGRNPAAVPFVIALRKYEQAHVQETQSLVQFIAKHISAFYHCEVHPQVIRYLCATGRAVVILDGLDELLDTSRRLEMTSIVQNFARAYPLASLLVTSRRVGYREAPLPRSRFTTWAIGRLSDADVEHYVRKWFSLERLLSDAERVSIAKAFLEQSESAKDLRSNALMLGLLCNVYKGDRYVPENRAELYESCARLLFDKWDASRGIQIGGVLRNDARRALQEIALWLYLDGVASDGVTERKLRGKLVSYWRRVRYENRLDAERAADELLELWRGRAWVLSDAGTTGAGERKYKFTHQTFLEYFAARELVRRNSTPRQLWMQIGPRLARGEWDVVCQISIQVMDDANNSAKATILKKLVEASRTSSSLRVQANYLSFAARNLHTLQPEPSSCRAIACAATDLFIESVSRWEPGTSFSYFDLAQADYEASAEEAEINSGGPENDEGLVLTEILRSPLYQLLETAPVFSGILRDEAWNELVQLASTGNVERRERATICGLIACDQIRQNSAPLSSFEFRIECQRDFLVSAMAAVPDGSPAVVELAA